MPRDDKDPRAWIKVHNGLLDHPKVEPLSDGAFRLLVGLWCWCSRQQTDGRVPGGVWARRGAPRTRRELVAAGLVEEDEDGVVMHDYLEHQESAEQIRERREKRVQAGRKGGQARSRNQASATASAQAGATASGKPAGGTSQAEVDVDGENERTTSSRASAPAVRVADATAPADERAAGGEDARVLVGEWIDHCGDRPPSRVVGHVAKELGLMLGEGIPYVDVRAGLAAWHGRGLHPSALASVVHEHRTADQRTPRLSRREQEQAATDGMYERMMARAAEREAAEMEAS